MCVLSFGTQSSTYIFHIMEHIVLFQENAIFRENTIIIFQEKPDNFHNVENEVPLFLYF